MVSVYVSGKLAVFIMRCAPKWTMQQLKAPKQVAKGAAAAAAAAAKKQAAPPELEWGEVAVSAPEGVDVDCCRWEVTGATVVSLRKPIAALRQATVVPIVDGVPPVSTASRFDELPEAQRGSITRPDLGEQGGVFPVVSHMDLVIAVVDQFDRTGEAAHRLLVRDPPPLDRALVSYDEPLSYAFRAKAYGALKKVAADHDVEVAQTAPAVMGSALPEEEEEEEEEEQDTNVDTEARGEEGEDDAI